MTPQAKTFQARLTPHTLNIFSALMPSLEGLFLMTVHDGKQGKVLFRYDASLAKDMEDFIEDMARRHPRTIERIPDQA